MFLVETRELKIVSESTEELKIVEWPRSGPESLAYSPRTRSRCYTDIRLHGNTRGRALTIEQHLNDHQPMRAQITRTRSRCYTFTYTCMGTPEAKHSQLNNIDDQTSNHQKSKYEVKVLYICLHGHTRACQALSIEQECQIEDQSQTTEMIKSPKIWL